jgi:DNA-binding response OmpR family regulator
LRSKLTAFERGADDILTVPFSPEELLARTLAIMRRAYSKSMAFTPTIKLGDLEVDIPSCASSRAFHREQRRTRFILAPNPAAG